MKSKIITHGFNDQLIINTVQTMHFKDLYHNFFCGMIEEQRTKKCISPDFNEKYCNWALEEALKLGLVTIYHFWEKCLKKLIKEQSDFLKIQLTVKWMKNKSFVEYSKEILKNDFSCIIDDESWNLIDESRKVVNLYKHGNQEDYKLIKNEFPYYFESYNPNGNLDISEYFYLGKNNFNRLTSGIVNFWEKIPHTPKF